MVFNGGFRISRQGSVDPLGGGGCGCPMWVLFSENVCENGTIGSRRRGVGRARPLDPPIVLLQQRALGSGDTYIRFVKI